MDVICPLIFKIRYGIFLTLPMPKGRGFTASMIIRLVNSLPQISNLILNQSSVRNNMVGVLYSEHFHLSRCSAFSCRQSSGPHAAEMLLWHEVFASCPNKDLGIKFRV